MNLNIRSGFTLVEAAIAAVVIAVLLAVLVPILREQHEQREQQRLQALAEAEPWEVFEFRASHVLDPVTAHGGFVSIRCEIMNPPKYRLTLPQDSMGYVLTLWVILGTQYLIIGFP